MDVNTHREQGGLNISEVVIEKIVSVVIAEVEGVHGLAPSPSRVQDMLLRSERNKPVRLKLSSGVAQVDIYLLLKPGYKLKDVAENVQECVKEEVQNMTSVTVSKVNVYIQGVQTTGK